MTNFGWIVTASKRRTEELHSMRSRRDVAAMKEVFNLHNENETQTEKLLKEFIYQNEPTNHKYIKDNIRR